MFKSPTKKKMKRQTKSLPLIELGSPKGNFSNLTSGLDSGANKDDGSAATRAAPNQSHSAKTRRRTAEDFLLFCNVILDYTNYDQMRQQEIRRRHNSSPSLGSTGSGNESLPHSSTSGAHDLEDDDDSDEISQQRRNRLSAPSAQSKRMALINQQKPKRGRKPMKMKFEAEKALAKTEDDETADDDFDDEQRGTDEEEGGEDWNQVTCYCGRPFAGRPMVECSGCLTWVHLKCAKLTRQRIPETWFCERCKSLKGKNDLGDAKLDVKKMKKHNNVVVKKEENVVDAEKVSGSRKRKLTSRRQKISTEEEATKQRRLSSGSDLSNPAA